MTTAPQQAAIAQGSSDADVATVPGDAANGAPTGSVTFYVCGPTTTPTPCTAKTSEVGAAAVTLSAGSNNTASATSPTFTPTAPGYWCFAGYYSGDTNYPASSDTGTDECVDVVEAAITIAPANGTDLVGGSHTYTVSAQQDTGSGLVAVPTGTVPSVTLTNSGGASATVTGGTCGSGGTNASGQCTVTISSPTAGSTSVSAAVTLSVGGVTLTRSTTGPDANGDSAPALENWVGGMTTAPQQAAIAQGSSDADVATVPGDAANGVPTGSVTFYVCGPTTTPTPCTAKTSEVGAAAVTLSAGSNNTASATSPTFTPTAPGYWCFAGYYSGDTNYPASSDTGTDECVDVVEAAITIAPANGTDLVGGSHTYTVSAQQDTGSGLVAVPTGTVPSVTLTNSGGASATVTGGTCGSGGTNASGQCTVTISSPTAGSTSVSAAVTLSVGGVTLTRSTTGPDANGDSAPALENWVGGMTTAPQQAAIAQGSSDADVATVPGDAANGAPTGSVTFYVCGPTTTPTPCTAKTSEVGAAAVTLSAGSNNTASATSPTFTPTAPGYWCFAGYYSGDTNYPASSDTGTDECVDVTSSGLAGGNNCNPTSSLGVQVQGRNVTAYVPAGSWDYGSNSNGSASYDASDFQGISVVNVEGNSITPTGVYTPDVVNACSSDPTSGQSICTSNGTDIYLLKGTSLTKTLMSSGSGQISFSGGSCTTCGVAMDSADRDAAISESVGSKAGFQFLDLDSSTLESPFVAASGENSEGPVLDPAHHLLLNANENGDFEIADIKDHGSPVFYENNISPTQEWDSSAEDCSTGIAIAGAEYTEPSTLYVTDLSQATLEFWFSRLVVCTLSGADSFGIGSGGRCERSCDRSGYAHWHHHDRI